MPSEDTDGELACFGGHDCADATIDCLRATLAARDAELAELRGVGGRLLSALSHSRALELALRQAVGALTDTLEAPTETTLYGGGNPNKPFKARICAYCQQATEGEPMEHADDCAYPGAMAALASASALLPATDKGDAK
jgi:hypothetical protein